MSVNIQSLSSLLTTSAVSGTTGGSSRSSAPGHLSTAADVLGLSTAEVTKALKSGSSLAELAEQQGVSRDDLTAALIADAPDELKESGEIDQLVANLIDATGISGPGGGGRPSGPPPAPPTTGAMSGSLTTTQSDTLSAIADLLETDTDSLLESLQSGNDLGSLLEAKGISLSDLSGAIQDGLLIDTTA